MVSMGAPGLSNIASHRVHIELVAAENERSIFVSFFIWLAAVADLPGRALLLLPSKNIDDNFDDFSRDDSPDLV